MVSPRGVADAELRWNHTRGIPRAEQRGADSSGLRGRAFLRSAAEGGGRGRAERGEAMTRQRDLKRIIRERQSKTGESLYRVSQGWRNYPAPGAQRPFPPSLVVAVKA